MIGLLQATSGPLQGNAFTLGARTLVGRSGEADIQLPEQAVSRRHALILRLDDGRFWIGDLSSTNGTFLGDQPVESHCLRPGDILHMGKSTLVYAEASHPAEVGVSAELNGVQLLSGPVENATRGLPLSWLQGIWRRQRTKARQGASDTLPLSPSQVDETATMAVSQLGY